MTHAEFITRITEAKTCADKVAELGSSKKAAVALQLPKGTRIKCKVKYYERYGLDPQIPELGSEPHSFVCRAFMSRVGLPADTLTDKSKLRRFLIKNYSGSIGLSKPYPPHPQHFVKAWMKISGLEFFQQEDRLKIHWKHDRELAA